jgi:hypothetical protein
LQTKYLFLGTHTIQCNIMQFSYFNTLSDRLLTKFNILNLVDLLFMLERERERERERETRARQYKYNFLKKKPSYFLKFQELRGVFFISSFCRFPRRYFLYFIQKLLFEICVPVCENRAGYIYSNREWYVCVCECVRESTSGDWQILQFGITE